MDAASKLLRIEHLIEAIPAYVYSVTLRDGEAIATEHGQGCVAVTGYAPEDYVRDPNLWISMVHPEDREEVSAQIGREINDADPGPIEHRIIHRDGSVRWIRNTIVHRLASDGSIIGYDGLIEDITERKVTRIALEKARVELEERVQQRTAELTAANEDLRKAMARLEQHDRERIQFVSNVSHDLKNPVMSMGFAIENLLKGAGGEIPQKAREALMRLREDIRRLGRTLSDILDISRMEEKRLSLNRIAVPFAMFAHRAVESMRGYAEEKGLYLSVKDGGASRFLDCDPARTQRAVANLLHNAIKFTPPGGTIDVVLKADSGGRMNSMEINDTGVGIPADKLSQIGVRYFRATESIPGSGLGLASAKQMLSLQGGGLNVRSPVPGTEKGTQVVLSFRAAAAPVVLVADASEPSRLLMYQQLKAHGYEAVAVGDQEAFFDALARDNPALIMIDLNLAGMSASEMVTKIKAHSEWRRLPMVVPSAATADPEKIETLKRFEIPTLQKPWKEQELLDKVYDALVGRYLLA